MHLVREETSASLRLQTVFTSRDQEEGTCTEGKSSRRQETSLSARASRLSVFVRRAPTPRERTSEGGTSLPSCPRLRARSATENASEQVSIETIALGHSKSSSRSRLVSFCSWTILPVESLTQTWDSLEPRSIAIWCMAGLLS